MEDRESMIEDEGSNHISRKAAKTQEIALRLGGFARG
jgi:hypothetical protein